MPKLYIFRIDLRCTAKYNLIGFDGQEYYLNLVEFIYIIVVLWTCVLYLKGGCLDTDCNLWDIFSEQNERSGPS